MMLQLLDKQIKDCVTRPRELVSPKVNEGGCYTAGGNLPLGDLMGKEELAQGSSNGLRTIHDLA